MIYLVIQDSKTKVLGFNEEIKPTLTNLPSSAPILTPSDTPLSTSSPTNTPLLYPTPSIIPKQIPTLTPTETSKPTPLPLLATSQEINSFIERFAAQYGVDPNILRHIALCESGFNSTAIHRNYAGLYQFTTISWTNIRREIGEDINPDLRFSAEESVQTAAYALSKGKGGIWPNCLP